MYHYRKTRKKYASYPRTQHCAFCDVESHRDKIIAEFEYCYIIPNRTFYDVWELRSVTDHMLVVPKEHTESIGDLPERARSEIMEAIASYEAQGYNFYARGPGSTQKSVPHQHTHLIKTADKSSRVALYLKKPYFLIKF